MPPRIWRAKQITASHFALLPAQFQPEKRLPARMRELRKRGRTRRALAAATRCAKATCRDLPRRAAARRAGLWHGGQRGESALAKQAAPALRAGWQPVEPRKKRRQIANHRRLTVSHPLLL